MRGNYIGLVVAIVVACSSLSAQAPATTLEPDVTEPTERLLDKNDVEADNPYEGVYSQRLWTDTVWITMVRIEAGAASRHHNHPDEQTMLFHTGRARAVVGDNEYEMGPGSILVIPSYMPHHVEAVEESTWTEVHGPGFNNAPKWEQ